MAEYDETRWRCDWCDRTVKRGVMPSNGFGERPESLEGVLKLTEGRKETVDDAK